jgi:hypothetical protein
MILWGVDVGLPEHFAEYAASARLKIVYLDKFSPEALEPVHLHQLALNTIN